MARASAAEWSKRVRRWRRSGLTAKQYAAKAGLNPSTLTYWSWRLSAQQPAATEVAYPPSGGSGALVEIAVAHVTAPIEIALEGGTRVRVPAGADEATLAMVLRALEVAR